MRKKTFKKIVNQLVESLSSVGFFCLAKQQLRRESFFSQFFLQLTEGQSVLFSFQRKNFQNWNQLAKFAAI